MIHERCYLLAMRRLFVGCIVPVAFLLTIAPLRALGQSSADTLAMLSSSDKGVTIKVTPKSNTPTDIRWEFAVVLDTHSGDLSDDLTQSATLVTNDGRTLKPVSWSVAAPGGHHREGVLAFDVFAPRPTMIELKITRPGESAPRTFRWKL